MIVARGACYSSLVVAILLLAPLSVAASPDEMLREATTDFRVDVRTFGDLLESVTPSADNTKFIAEMTVLNERSPGARKSLSKFLEDLRNEGMIGPGQLRRALVEPVTQFRKNVQSILSENNDLLQRLDLIRATMTLADKRSLTGEYVKSPEQRHRVWQEVLAMFNEVKSMSSSLHSDEGKHRLAIFVTEAEPLITEEPEEFWPFAKPFLQYQQYLKVVQGALTPNVTSREVGIEAQAHRVTGAERLGMGRRKVLANYMKTSAPSQPIVREDTLPNEWQRLFGEMTDVLGEVPSAAQNHDGTDTLNQDTSAAPQSGRAKIIEQLRQLVNDTSAHSRYVIGVNTLRPTLDRMLERYVQIFDEYWGRHKHDTSGSSMYTKISPLLWHTMKLSPAHKRLAMQALDKAFFPPKSSGRKGSSTSIKQTGNNAAIGIKHH